MKSVEAHRGAVAGVAVRGTDPRALATWSDTPGVNESLSFVPFKQPLISPYRFFVYSEVPTIF